MDSNDINVIRQMEKLKQDIKALSNYSFECDDKKINDNLELVLMLVNEDFRQMGIHLESAKNLIAAKKQSDTVMLDENITQKQWMYKTGMYEELDERKVARDDPNSYQSHCMKQVIIQYVDKKREYILRYRYPDEFNKKIFYIEYYDTEKETFGETIIIDLNE